MPDGCKPAQRGVSQVSRASAKVTLTLNQTLKAGLHLVIVPGETPRWEPQVVRAFAKAAGFRFITRPRAKGNSAQVRIQKRR